MKGGKDPIKTQNLIEKSVKINPAEKPIEKPEEKPNKSVENNKKPAEKPKEDQQPDEKPNEDSIEPTESPPDVPKEEEIQKKEAQVTAPSENSPSDETSTEIKPKQDTETIINHVVQTFKNSEDIGEALERLATEIPVAVLLNFFDKFLAIIEGVLAKVQEKLGVDAEFKDPENAMKEIKENLPKIKYEGAVKINIKF